MSTYENFLNLVNAKRFDAAFDELRESAANSLRSFEDRLFDLIELGFEKGRLDTISYFIASNFGRPEISLDEVFSLAQ